jgi:hypothetical protein
MFIDVRGVPADSDAVSWVSWLSNVVAVDVRCGCAANDHTGIEMGGGGGILLGMERGISASASISSDVVDENACRKR